MPKKPDEAQESPADKLKREKAEREALEAAGGEAPPEEAKADDPGPPETISAAEADALEDEQKLHQTAEEAEAEEKAIAERQARDEAAIKARREQQARADAFESQRAARQNPPLTQGAEILGQPGSEMARHPIRSEGKAWDKLNWFAQQLPATTSENHVLFGMAGERFTAGDLRELVGLPRRG